MIKQWTNIYIYIEYIKTKYSNYIRNQYKYKLYHQHGIHTILIVLVLILTTVTILLFLLLYKLLFGMCSHLNDYTGNGLTDIVIQIHEGDSTVNIAKTLQKYKVINTIDGFIYASRQKSIFRCIQPGFYRIRTNISDSSAVERLASPINRVGRLIIPEGRQLDDIVDLKNNCKIDGIFSLIAQTSCILLNSKIQCVSVDELKKAAQKAPLESLAIPKWASIQVKTLNGNYKRIEGLISSGMWNINPTVPAQNIICYLIANSVNLYTGVGLLKVSAIMQLSPYQILTLASLAQKETKPQDFSKIIRVIYNRIIQNRKLELDSTVNYLLNNQEIATARKDRFRPTMWNTYVYYGLPKTPICTPGTDVLNATGRPANGDWLYFVTINLSGITLFTNDYNQHLTNVKLAQENGVLNSVK